jgi:16S rRNA (adenine1518-N6/adenine1519-N6)-dimethyltransferase
MQEEVALRLANPSSREAGALTYIAGAFFHTEYLFKVPPSCFSPPPKVDSAVVRLRPRTEIEPPSPKQKKLYEQIVSTAFRYRRKQLGRSLRTLHTDAPEILEKSGLDSKRRPETLTVQEFWDLARNWPRE